MSREVYTTNEAARLLGIARTSLINWVERGELEPATTPGGHRRFRRSDLTKFAKKHGFSLDESALENSEEEVVKEGRRILLVDDDENFRRFAHECLGIAGNFEVKEAANGIEAALLVGSWKPHAILLDLHMPKMNGFEFISQMRSNADFAKVRVVVVTAYADEQTRKELKNFPHDALIVKPIGIKDFVETLRGLVV